MPILTSILENDLYKFSMQRAVLSYRQGVPVTYGFINRKPDRHKFNETFLDALKGEIENMSTLALTNDEQSWMQNHLPWLGDDYLSFLSNYRFNPNQVSPTLDDQGNLKIAIVGVWEKAIMWEVPLLSLVSELYFKHCDTNWLNDDGQQRALIREKMERLAGLNVAEFGTRRRRTSVVQDLVVGEMKNMPGFSGTSNVFLAYKHRVRSIGTMAHEWIMGISALESLRHANRYALRIWSDVFKGRLGIALPDTFGTDAFFEDFDNYLARLYDGVRHDSGDPYEFCEKLINHYNKLGVPPITKTCVFTDSLYWEAVCDLAERFEKRIRVAFGIGTNLTNDFVLPNGITTSSPLNIVIKLMICNGVQVVKKSDVPSKSIGDRDAQRVVDWTFNKRPLDA